VLGILKDLLLGRAARSGFLFGRLAAPVLHFSLVESHGGIVAERARLSMSALPPKAAATATNWRVR
jgi:hypothetical protein